MSPAFDAPFDQSELDRLVADAEKQQSSLVTPLGGQTSPRITTPATDAPHHKTGDEQPPAYAVIDNPDCDHADSIIIERNHCLICHVLTCPKCCSLLDKNFCRRCLTVADVELKESPLKDADGVIHPGRELSPQGPRWGTLCKYICDMTIPELYSFITEYKAAVRQAEIVLDTRRILLGTAEIELSQKKEAERRRLRQIKTPRPRQQTVVGTNTQKTRSASVAPIMSAKQVSDVLKVLEALAKAKAKPNGQ